MADVDLTQYNGTASFPSTADVGTNADPFLEPTDGKIVTASSNLTLEAPVDRALERTKDLLLGLRDGIVGDRPAAARKTLYSLYADGAGANPNTLPAGTIQAEQDIIAVSGDILAQLGAITAVNGNITAERTAAVVQAGSAADIGQLRSAKVAFLGTTTGTGGANPPLTTPIPNELRAVNVPKAALFLVMSAPGVIASGTGFGISAVTILAGVLVVGFSTPFDNAHFTVTSQTGFNLGATKVLTPIEDNAVGRTTSSCRFLLWDNGTSTTTDFMTEAFNLQIHVFGQQTT